MLDAKIFTKLQNDLDLTDNIVFGYGVTARDTNDYLIFNSFSKGLYYDADGSGSGLAIQFATLTNIANLNASNFVVI